MVPYIPNYLKIGGHHVTIVFKEMEDCGVWEESRGEICINSNMPQSRQESTLIHEILHVLNSTLSETREGHILHDSLAEQLYQVLKDNPISFYDQGIQSDNT